MIKLVINPYLAIAHKNELDKLGKIRDGLRVRGYDADLLHIQKAYEWFKEEHYGKHIRVIDDRVPDSLIDALLGNMATEGGE